MRYVLDSSVAFKWCVSEADSDKADRLRGAFRQQVHELIAPAFFTTELAHALTRAERQGRIGKGDALALWMDAMRTCPFLFPADPISARAIQIASDAGIGVYDCVYVALAEREKCDFVTADTTVVNVLASNFPFIKTLASMP